MDTCCINYSFRLKNLVFIIICIKNTILTQLSLPPSIPGAEEAQRVGGGARLRTELQDRGARQPGHRGARSGLRGRHLPAAARRRRVVRNFEAKVSEKDLLSARELLRNVPTVINQWQLSVQIPGGPGCVRGRALRGGPRPGTRAGGARTDRTRTQVRSRGGDD